MIVFLTLLLSIFCHAEAVKETNRTNMCRRIKTIACGRLYAIFRHFSSNPMKQFI